MKGSCQCKTKSTISFLPFNYWGENLFCLECSKQVEWTLKLITLIQAHLFTYHDFDAGILGLAHIGKYESVKGDGMGSMGICAGKQKDKFKANQNTALTTTLNWGKRILSTEAELVTVMG